MATVLTSEQYAERFNLAQHVLGPVFNVFCAGLMRELEALKRNGTWPILLYETRAGVRLQQIFDFYCRAKGIESGLNEQLIYISRLSAIKGCLSDNFELVSGMLIGEYRGESLSAMLAALDIDMAGVSLTVDQEAEVTRELFEQLYFSEDDAGLKVRRYFSDQSVCFARYVSGLIGDCTDIVLIDSGWSGSTQLLLMKQFPGVNWTGLYYGRWRYGKERPEQYSAIKGICVDDDRQCRLDPRRLSLIYYHLIEGVLEPEMASVTGYKEGPENTVVSLPDQVYHDSHDDPLYAGILACIDRERSGAGRYGAGSWASLSAFFRLMMYVVFPSRKSAVLLAVSSRSMDVGKAGAVEPVYLSENYPGLSRTQRIQKSLWRPGQYSIEFPRILSLPMQFLYVTKRVLWKREL